MSAASPSALISKRLCRVRPSPTRNAVRQPNGNDKHELTTFVPRIEASGGVDGFFVVVIETARLK